MSFQNLLITGGCGFIPSNFVNHVLEQQASRRGSASGQAMRIINYDKLTLASNKNYITPSENYKLVSGDVCNKELVANTLEQFSIDAVVHFAGETHVDYSFANPLSFVRTNIEGTVTLLEACKEYNEKHAAGAAAGRGIRKFVYISTDEVYGDTRENKTESACPAPTNPYSASKISAEHFVDVFRVAHNLPCVTVRMSNIYGPNQSHDKVVPKFIKAAISGAPMTVHGNGQQKRAWLFVRDACTGINTVLNEGRVGEIYNIGSTDERSILELAGQIQENVDKLTGRTPSAQASIKHIEDRPYNDQRYQIDATKLNKETEWEPIVRFEDGIRDTVQWYLDNEDIKEDRERILVYGSEGWIGRQFITMLEEKNIEHIKASDAKFKKNGENIKYRLGDDPDREIEEGILEVAPTHIIAFIGRTHGPGNNTIDYLEGGPDKLQLNLRDNLYGPMLLAELSRKLGIHFTYIGSGCLFTYTDQHPIGSPGFTEEDVPNYFGSSYSVVKGFTDRLMHHNPSVLNVRMRLPITYEEHSRNLITKLASYNKIMNVPNSVTVLPELLPILLDLMKQRKTGTINLVNPGYIEHTDVLEPYKELINPSLKYQLFSLDDPSEFAQGLRSKRSNCFLSTEKLEGLVAPKRLKSGKDAVRIAIEKIKENKPAVDHKE